MLHKVYNKAGSLLTIGKVAWNFNDAATHLKTNMPAVPEESWNHSLNPDRQTPFSDIPTCNTGLQRLLKETMD